MTALLANTQNPAALHLRRKIVINNGTGQYPVAENTSSAVSSPDPPPYLSRFSHIFDSIQKSSSAKSASNKVASNPTVSRVTGPSTIVSPLEDNRDINSPSISKTSPSRNIVSVKVPVAPMKPNEVSGKTARAMPTHLANKSSRSDTIPVHRIAIAQTSAENKNNSSARVAISRLLPTKKAPASTFSPSRGASSSENIPLKQSIERLSRVQTQAKISLPNDSTELEARIMAKNIMSMRASDWRPEREARVKRNTVQIPTLMGGGFPLSTQIRSFMEPRFRQDLSHVRIHTGEQADQLCLNLRARAFTVGSHIFFGKDQFQPGSQNGLELVAHEITHTFHQGTMVRRSEDGSGESSHSQEDEGWAISKALDYAAEHANAINGFRLFTIVLGVNPINMSKVDDSPANILRALVEVIPGGQLISDALNNNGIFDKVADWMKQQIKTLGMIGSSIKQALIIFLKSLSWGDLADVSGAWERAKKIFTDPIDRIKDFAGDLVGDIIKFIKDAILMPLAALAARTPFWDLLIGVLGKNPITNEEIPQSAEKLIGGFMKLIGQEEVWENMQKAKAVDRAWAWFQGAMSTLLGFVGRIPDLATKAFEELKLEDIVLVTTAFEKVAGVFGNFVSEFTNWALDAVWNLLEIIFEVVKPGALEYIKRTGAAFKSILQDPMPFVGNLVKAAKLGFENFAANFVTHLKKGLIDWLTGSLPGVYIPQAFSLGEIVKFVFSVLGVSWQNVRQKLVKVVGEPVVKAMETGFDIVMTLVTQGPAAAWDKIKEQISNLKDMVIGGITDLVVDAVVKKAIPKLIAMFIPGAGFLSAIISIYDTVMVFVNKLSQIGQVVIGFINSIVAIASGDIGGAASRVEGILAGIMSLAINFLAGFAGLGKVADKIMGVIEKIRAVVDKGLDALIEWIVKMAKKLFAKVFGKKEDKEEKEEKGGDVGESVPFSTGDAQHRIFIQLSGTHSTVMVASTPEPLEASLSRMESQVSALSPPTQSKAASLIGSARSLLSKTSREADTAAAALAAPGASGAETATTANDQIKSDEHSLADMLGQLYVLFDGAAGLPFSMPVNMAGEGHTLTVKDENGYLAVWFASREQAILDKFAQVKRILERWEKYIDSIGNPTIKEEFTVLLKPEIEAKKTSALEGAVAHLKGIKSEDFMKLKAEIDTTIKALATEISVWASGAGVPVKDFSDEAIKSELERTAEEEAERLWMQRQKETQNKLEQFAGQIQALDPAARLKYRGSLAKGRKGITKEFGDFDPWNFDIDFFVESDKLYQEAIGDDPDRTGEVWAGSHPGLSKILSAMADAYDSIPGVRKGKFSMKLRSTSNTKTLRAKSGSHEHAGERHVEISPPPRKSEEN